MSKQNPQCRGEYLTPETSLLSSLHITKVDDAAVTPFTQVVHTFAIFSIIPFFPMSQLHSYSLKSSE
jgi:hypothetical protein